MRIGDLDLSKLQPENRGRLLLKIAGERPFELYEADLSKEAKTELTRLNKSAQDVEAIFMRHLLSEMMPKEMMGEDAMAGYVRDQFLDGMSHQAAQGGGIGIAKLLKEQLAKNLYQKEAAKHIQNQPKKETNEL